MLLYPHVISPDSNLIAAKHATMSHFLRRRRRILTRRLRGEGYLDGRESLKVRSWDPAGYNKDLRERALSDIAPCEWGRGRRGLRRATKNAARLQAAGCARSRYPIHPSCYCVVFDPGFRVYAVTYSLRYRAFV